MTIDNRLLTEREASEYLGLKNHNTLSVWRCTQKRLIPYVKIGSAVRYKKSDLDSYIETNTIGGGNENL